MNREEMKTALSKVFCEVFNNQSLKISETTTANDVEEWDSSSYINLISAIEIRFDVEFTQAEVMNFENVGKLMESLFAKLSK